MTKQQSVTFDQVVVVWPHALTLGDHPACALGPPVALDYYSSSQQENNKPLYWNLNQVQDVQEQRYAAVIQKRQGLRRKHEPAPHGPPVRRRSAHQRVTLLQQTGHGDTEIHEAERAVRRIRHQRAWTLRQTTLQRSVAAWQRTWRRLGARSRQRAIVESWYDYYGKVEQWSDRIQQ